MTIARRLVLLFVLVGAAGFLAAGCSNGAPALEATDYSDAAHWLSVPADAADKPVDIFYLYPSSYQKPGADSPNICTIVNPIMLKNSKLAFARQATAFETVGNIYAPYYRQADAVYTLALPQAEQDAVVSGIPTTDATAAFARYIDEYNNGRPFILAGHSQGSNVLLYLLSGYLKDHPDVYKRMIAAYVIGYSVTPEYLAANPHLKFAAGPDDTGVIISYNTEAPEIGGKNPVLLPGALAINPITWTAEETSASAAQNLGSIALNQDGSPVLGADGTPAPVKDFADATVNRAKGVIICSTAPVDKFSPGNALFPEGVFHTFDYPFYYFDIRANAAQRVAKFLGTTPAGSQSDYGKAYNIGLQAYTYGLPLLTTNKTFLTMTSVNVSSNGFGPVNQFNSVRKLNDPTSTAIVAPGANSLSSIASLEDLTKEPQVLHVPKVTDHDFVLALLDPFTEDLRNLGSAHATPAGDYVICGPGQHDAQLPAGTQRIDVNYTRIWVIGSTQLKGPDDVANVNKIQDGYTLTPLSKYGTDYQPPAPAQPDTTVNNYNVPTGLEFFDTLGQLLEQFPPPAADNDQVAAFATVGIGPGKTPSKDSNLSADTIRGLKDAIAAGPAQVQADTKTVFEASAKKHNGYFLGGFGAYGTDYQLRAVVAVMGLGAFTSDQAIFAMCLTDGSGTALDGSSDYAIHMPTTPPGGEGWTLTVYDTKGALIQNSLGRYQFNQASTLAKNADGSLDIYVQATQPTDAAQAQNWLPVAGGQGFEVIWRLMAPEPDKIDGILDGTGWQPPAVMQAGAPASTAGDAQSSTSASN